MEPEDLKSSYATVMSHFYRGELGRMMVWRERIDRTTNWSIVAVTGLTSFTWAHTDYGSVFLIIGNVILYLLLAIEARRYRFYDAYRARVRVLESHFILPHVAQIEKRKEGNWRSLLVTDLAIPSFKISFWESISRRLRRNYIWLFLILLISWGCHTAMHMEAVNGKGFMDMIGSNQPFPPILFLVFILAFYSFLFGLVLLGFRKRKASGQFQKRPPDDKFKWSI